MLIKFKSSSKIYDLLVYILLLAIMVNTVYPLLYVAFASFSEGGQLMAYSGFLWKPLGFTLFAYKKVLENHTILTGYVNTALIVGGGITVNLTVTILAAYVLSRKNVLWNGFLIIFIVFTMFFNGGLIPFFLVVKNLGLLNSLWSIILPFAINTYYLIIMRTSFLTLPDSLEESAKIDGANHFTILLHIVIPLSMPVIALVIMYTAVDKWNTWFTPSIFITNRKLYPLQLVLREILIANSTEKMTVGSQFEDLQNVSETIKYASIMVATVPVLFIYPFLQKYFVKGIIIGALKE